MAFPFCKANPAKFMTASLWLSASHVITSLVFLYRALAARTKLGVLVNPDHI